MNPYEAVKALSSDLKTQRVSEYQNARENRTQALQDSLRGIREGQGNIRWENYREYLTQAHEKNLSYAEIAGHIGTLEGIGIEEGCARCAMVRMGLVRKGAE